MKGLLLYCNVSTQPSRWNRKYITKNDNDQEMMPSLTNAKQPTSYRQANWFWEQVKIGFDGKSVLTGRASIHSKANKLFSDTN